VSTTTYRVYADTSVFGGVFDAEFAIPSRTFFDQVNSGRCMLVTSALVQAELDAAPDEVRLLFDEMITQAEIAGVNEMGNRRTACGPCNGDALRIDCQLEFQAYRPF
jgi:hypothetical protein